MPDRSEQHSYRRRLIKHLRALADRLEAEEQAEACQRTEMEARRLRAQMRRINRRGHMAVILAALWLLRHPFHAAAMAAATAGVIAWAGITQPWTNGEGVGRGRPPAASPPQTRPSPSPTPTASPSPSPTPAGPAPPGEPLAPPEPTSSESPPTVPPENEPATPAGEPGQGCLVDLNVNVPADVPPLRLLCR